MKYFGTIKSFDTIKGHGEIKQEAGGDDLRFEKSAIRLDPFAPLDAAATRALRRD